MSTDLVIRQGRSDHGCRGRCEHWFVETRDGYVVRDTYDRAWIYTRQDAEWVLSEARPAREKVA